MASSKTQATPFKLIATPTLILQAYGHEMTSMIHIVCAVAPDMSFAWPTFQSY
jgi:hypothetical protein